jgi:3-oxoacyl-[acyl-carrier protein] reductase
MMIDITESTQVCVISGTSRGLGRAFAVHFLDKGYAVAGCSRGDSTIDYASYRHTCLDVREEADIQKWAGDIRRSFGKVDVLICNAGLARSTLLLPMTPGDEFEDFLRTNFASVFYTLREFSKIMLSRESGRILTISSTMAALHQEGTASYSATKAAVTEMTKTLARELAPKNITCNVIAPAMMETDASEALAKVGDWRQQMLDKQTFPRVIDMNEVCHVADFFISPEAASITGQIVYIGLVD